MNATVQPVEEADASTQVAAVFDDIKATKQIDFVPLFWRTIARHPDQLELVWQQVKRWMHPEACGATSHFDPMTRELLAIAVSATNGCSYCLNSHTAAAYKQGLSQEALAEAMAIIGLFNLTNATADGFQIEPDVRPQL